MYFGWMPRTPIQVRNSVFTVLEVWVKSGIVSGAVDLIAAKLVYGEDGLAIRTSVTGPIPAI